MRGSPPLLNLALLNIKHWQSQSEQDNILHVARVPILSVYGLAEGQELTIGSSSAMRGKQSVLFKVNEAGTEQLLREGVLGRLQGFNIHSSAGVKRAPTSSAAGYLVNGAKQEGDIIIAIDTGTGAIAAGQVVTFVGDNNKYVVAASSATTITLSAPGLRQDLADNVAITVISGFTANMLKAVQQSPGRYARSLRSQPLLLLHHKPPARYATSA